MNENTNGLVRQYFPKGSSFEEITDADVKMVMGRLNHRPRKTLNYKTPFEVFLKILSAKLREHWNFVYELNLSFFGYSK